MPTIVSLDTRLARIPLRRPWGPDVREVHLIEVGVTDSAGSTGVGFSWTPTIGAEAVRALLDHDIRRFAIGREAEPESLWDALWAYLHEAGSGGITTIAMAGLDLALWDLRARVAETSITTLLGSRRETVEVYGSGVNLHYSLDELVVQVERWVATGYDAVKVKVGKPDLQEDLDRIAAVRDVLGPDRRLMVDANQRWDLATARRSLDALSRFDLAWMEEPLRADDLWGHAELRAGTAVPIALGENLHTVHRFGDFIRAGAVDIVQPNVVRVGGITPFLRIAALADESDIRLAPHLLPELSGQLALALDRPTMVEDVEDAGFAQLRILAGGSPVALTGARLRSTGKTGLGFEFPDSAFL